MNSFEAIIQAPTVQASEFSFEGYTLLRKQLTTKTFERLFGTPQKTAENTPEVGRLSADKGKLELEG